MCCLKISSGSQRFAIHPCPKPASNQSIAFLSLGQQPPVCRQGSLMATTPQLQRQSQIMVCSTMTVLPFNVTQFKSNNHADAISTVSKVMIPLIDRSYFSSPFDRHIVCQGYNIFLKQMKKALQQQFSFHQSFLALNAAPAAEADPIRHRLPPEPTFADSSQLPMNAQQREFSEHASQSKYENSSLLYSPDIPTNFQPKREISNTSPFLKQRDNQTPRKYVVKPYDAQIDVKIIPSSIKPSKPTINAVPAKNDANNFWVKQLKDEKKAYESITYTEESRNSKRPDNSIIKKLNFEYENQNTSRQGKESSVLKSKMNKPERIVLANETPESMALARQVEELRAKLTEMESLNASLRMQYQISREKLVTKEAENQSLKESNQQLSNLYDESQRNVQRFIKMEEEYVENKRMVNLFCDEIEQQKATNESLSSSLKQNQLQLERANEVNSKWEERLKQEADTFLIKQALFQREISDLNETINNCQLGNQQLNQEIGKLNEQLDILQSKLQLCEESLAETQKHNKQQQQKLDIAILRTTFLEQIEAQLKQQIFRFQAKVQQLQNEDNVKQAKIVSLEKEIQQQQKRHENEIQALKTAMKEKEKQHDTNIQQLTDKFNTEIRNKDQQHEKQIQQLVKNYKTEISAIKLQHQSQIQQIQTVIATIKLQHQSQLQQIQTVIRGQERIIEQGQVAKKMLQQRLSTAIKEGEIYMNKAKQLQQQKQLLESEKQALNTQIGKLQDKIKYMTLLIEQKQTEIDTLNERVQGLLKTIQLHQQSERELQIKLSEVNLQISSKEAQIGKLASINQALTDQNTSLIDKIEQLEQKLPNYDRVIASYKQSLQQLKLTHEQRWQELKRFYQEQFANLQAQLREYSQAENSKRNFKSFKKHILKRTTTTTQQMTALSESSRQNTLAE